MSSVRKLPQSFDEAQIRDLRRLYRALLEKAALETGMPREAIAGKKRTPALVRVRSGIWLEMWAQGWSTPEIGFVVGRDHSTVVRSNVIMRGADSQAGYAVRARAIENRRIAALASSAQKSVEMVRQVADIAKESRVQLENAQRCAAEAREAYEQLKRSMLEAVTTAVEVKLTETEAETERERRLFAVRSTLDLLDGRQQYDAVVEAMCALDDGDAMALWESYCRDTFPTTAATPPYRWEMRMKEAA